MRLVPGSASNSLLLECDAVGKEVRRGVCVRSVES